jgi:ureidoglycolate lyase
MVRWPERVGERFEVAGLESRRPEAQPSLRISMSKAAVQLPLLVRTMERHRFSSQTFVPIDASRSLIVVAPHDRNGGPDMTRAQAFIAQGDQGVHYDADVWHIERSPLDRPATFAMLIWRERYRRRP